MSSADTKRKNEQKFLTGLKKDFKRHDLYYYKIPDSPVATRFMIAKPFDCFIGVSIRRAAMEAKYLDLDKTKSVKLNDLRENQHEGLKHMIEHNGLAWVFYQVKVGKELRLYYWAYEDFVRECNAYEGKWSPNIHFERFKDQKHIIGKKNRFDVLEYDLGPFIEHSNWCEELYYGEND